MSVQFSNVQKNEINFYVPVRSIGFYHNNPSSNLKTRVQVHVINIFQSDLLPEPPPRLLLIFEPARRNRLKFWHMLFCLCFIFDTVTANIHRSRERKHEFEITHRYN